MGQLIRKVAITFGAGLGAGLGSVVTSRSASRGTSRVASRGALARVPQPSGPEKASAFATGDILRLEPLLDRLERIEAFVDAAEVVHPHHGPAVLIETDVAAPVPDAAAYAAVQELDRRIQDQESELRLLHSSVGDIERRASATLELVKSGFLELRSEIPGSIEASVSSRVADLEVRLQSDAKDAWHRSFETFENTIEQRVTDRIGSLERALTDQSASIGVLRTRAEDSDVNLQRLIVSIERLCEVAPPPPAPANSVMSGTLASVAASAIPSDMPPVAAPMTPPPLPARLAPLGARSQRADDDTPRRVTTVSSSPSGFLPRLVRETEREIRKPRVPMARIFVALMAFGISRIVR